MRYVFHPDRLVKALDLPPDPIRHLEVSDLPEDAILMKMEEVEDLEQDEDQDQDQDLEQDQDQDQDLEQDEDPDALAKERPHKYIKREPTGDAKRKWRYYYYVPGHGVVTSDGLKEGSRYAGQHEHEGVTHEGHFEVLQHHADTGHVTVRHTGSGQEQKLKHTEFADLVNRQHAAAHSSRKAQKIQEIEAAVEGLRKKSSPAQAKRVSKLVDEAARLGWLTTDEAHAWSQKAETTDRPKRSKTAEGKEPADSATGELSDDPNSPDYRYRDTGHAAISAIAAGTAGHPGLTDQRRLLTSSLLQVMSTHSCRYTSY